MPLVSLSHSHPFPARIFRYPSLFNLNCISGCAKAEDGESKRKGKKGSPLRIRSPLCLRREIVSIGNSSSARITFPRPATGIRQVLFSLSPSVGVSLENPSSEERGEQNRSEQARRLMLVAVIGPAKTVCLAAYTWSSNTPKVSLGPWDRSEREEKERKKKGFSFSDSLISLSS